MKCSVVVTVLYQNHWIDLLLLLFHTDITIRPNPDNSTEDVHKKLFEYITLDYIQGKRIKKISKNFIIHFQ